MNWWKDKCAHLAGRGARGAVGLGDEDRAASSHDGFLREGPCPLGQGPRAGGAGRDCCRWTQEVALGSQMSAGRTEGAGGEQRPSAALRANVHGYQVR